MSESAFGVDHGDIDKAFKVRKPALLNSQKSAHAAERQGNMATHNQPSFMSSGSRATDNAKAGVDGAQARFLKKPTRKNREYRAQAARAHNKTLPKIDWM